MEANPDERRRWTIFLVIGLVISCGPIFPILGGLANVLWPFYRIESPYAPTPGDLAMSVHLSVFAASVGLSMVGLLAPVVGVPLAVWSSTKQMRLRTGPEAEILR